MILKYLSPCINLKAAGARILKYGPKPARPSPFLRVRSSSSSAARVLVLLPGSLTSSPLSPPSFRVPTSIVSRALINYPGRRGGGGYLPPRADTIVILLLFLLARTDSKPSAKLTPSFVRYAIRTLFFVYPRAFYPSYDEYEFPPLLKSISHSLRTRSRFDPRIQENKNDYDYAVFGKFH